MNKIEILTNAFEYIEQNLQNDLKTEEIAGACYCSKSVLEKIFRFVSHIGVHEYITKRRMMLAARLMRAEPERNLLDIALLCGYSTNESFSRAFKRVWYCNPSEYKDKKADNEFELFPRLCPPIQDGGVYISMRRTVDISEMYDLFKQRRNCYFVCGDINSLVPINDISHKAGDIAILESMGRMQKEAGDEDIVFRIGGDEFVILTNSEDIKYAEDIAERIKSYNGQPIIYEDKEIPLRLHIAIVKFETDHLRYKDLFARLHETIMENK